jgi:hypothetical protein
MGGGGLSNVGLRRLSRPGNNGEETPLTEYLIYGERIVDKSVSITCHVPVHKEVLTENIKIKFQIFASTHHSIYLYLIVSMTRFWNNHHEV